MSARRSFRVLPDTPVGASFDLEERLKDATSADTLQGMFFERVLELARASRTIAARRSRALTPAGVLVAQDLKRSGRCARRAQGPAR